MPSAPPSRATTPGPGSPPQATFSTPNRNGVGFNDEKGSLTLFSTRSIRTYRAAPPMCWFKSLAHPRWRGSHGTSNFSIGGLVDTSLRYRAHVETAAWRDEPPRRPQLRAISAFYERLDREAVRLTQRISRDSWLLYCLLVRAPEVRDIARDNVALAMLMAHQRRMSGQRFPQMARLARRKRTEIVAACGLPAQKQWVRLLGRVPVEALSTHNLFRLVRTANTAPDLITHLRHLPQLSRGLFAVLDPAWIGHLDPNLLREIAADPGQQRPPMQQRYRTEGLLHDTIRMQRAANLPVPLIRSMAHLDQLHDEAVTRAVNTAPSRNRPFGPPPLPESAHIVGLRTPAALQEEADLQRNCLAARFWADDCYAETTYIYRVTAPQRASVAIRRLPHGAWIVYEFKTRFNAEPEAETVRAVRRWLRAGNQALASGWRAGLGDAPQLTDADFSLGLEELAEADGWTSPWFCAPPHSVSRHQSVAQPAAPDRPVLRVEVTST